MASKDALPLFGEADLISHSELRQEAAEALEPADGHRRADLDAARLWTSRKDGLLLRGVKPHSAEKSRLVSRGLGTVTSAMSGKWFASRHGLEYVELYAGPGRLLDESTGQELPGSPLEALGLKKPFDRYVFCDFTQECVDALEARVAGRSNVTVCRGDANDPEHLQAVGRLLNPKALVIAYLDPARPQDLHFDTVRYFAANFGFVDLIINLPVNSLMRGILGAAHGGGSGPGTAGRFLNHEDPRDLLRYVAGRFSTTATIDAIRKHYDQELVNLGFEPPARRVVHFPATNPYYDILMVSRHPRALDLWNKTNPIPEDPQLPLEYLG